MIVQRACASSNRQSSHALKCNARQPVTWCFDCHDRLCVCAGIATVGRHFVATGCHSCSQRAVGPDLLCPGAPPSHSTRLCCAGKCGRLDVPAVCLSSQERHLQAWSRSRHQAVLGQLPPAVQQPAGCGKHLLICQDCLPEPCVGVTGVACCILCFSSRLWHNC